jgi:hypothetical protein
MVDLLQHMQSGYGYDIYKAYVAVFPKVTLRSIYYHLKKGVALGEFSISKIEKEKGDFSWGSEVEKTYYALGQSAKPTGNERAKEYFEKKRAPPQTPSP